jgi:hypothetical protein
MMLPLGALLLLAFLPPSVYAHGGGHVIHRAKITEWAHRIDAPLTTESMRGFTGRPEEAWAEWRSG